MKKDSKDTGPYIAHIRSSDDTIQTVNEHLTAVRCGCEAFGARIGVSHLAGMAGLLHDLGKNTNAFKVYIQEAVAHSDKPPRRGSVDHSTAGGRFLYRRYHEKAKTDLEKVAVEWIANCIISHHQGLRDYLDPDLSSPFFERVALKAEGMEEYGRAEAVFLAEHASEDLDHYFSEATTEVMAAVEEIRRRRLHPIASALLVKYIFSCLIDADRTDARQFEEDSHEPWLTDHRDFFERSYRAVVNQVHFYAAQEDSEQPINQLRREMSEQCDNFATRSSGIFTLSIPTGGGKTLSSFRYALKHALETGKERIVYVAPYTTIIEQNADEIRKILQEEDRALILEHHSNVVENLDDNGTEYDVDKQRWILARDNWDRPLIFTTMVQFLNTFYAQGTRNARRLHRLSNAVIIFDEVQAVPPKCVALFNEALNFLSALAQSTCVLCTATQPTLDFVKNDLKLAPGAEIIEDLAGVTQKFKRVVVEDRTASPVEASELAKFIRDRMKGVNQVLVILNTKAAVRKLFAQLESAEWIYDKQNTLFHLSTNMCAAHRKDVLATMKQRLTKKAPVICVSTQLLEAGVDVSFDCVIRSLAGLDSIAQAAGRCNRHGHDPVRTVYIIQSSDEVLDHLPEIRVGAEITQRVLNEFASDPSRFGNDLLSPLAMKTFFRYYFHQIRGELDYPIPELNKTLLELLNNNTALFQAYRHRYGAPPPIVTRPSFATAERYFQVIPNAGRSVLVPYNHEANDLLTALNGEHAPKNLSELLHRAQQYVVNLYDHDVRSLAASGALYPLFRDHILAVRDTAYSQTFGIDAEDKGVWQPAFG